MKKLFLFTILGLCLLTGHAAPAPADEIFQISTKRIDPNTFVLHWYIKPGYFLYSDRIKITQPKGSNVELGKISFPETQQKVDKLGHVFTIYRDKLTLPVAVLGNEPGESLLDVCYQGCSDDGFCYPPENRQIKLTIDKHLSLAEVNLEKVQSKEVIAPKKPMDEIEAVFANHHWAFILLSFWGFGLLLAFTPCVLPMVPVLSGIIVGHGANMTTRKAFFLSLSYVLSMSLTYAIVGAVVAKLGSNLQVVMQNPWSISLFSLIFVLLALSMFGFYELRLPESWQSKLASLNRSQASGHYISAAIMGCLSTLILSPCVTAPLIGALGYIAQSGNMSLGFASLFALGLGMGTPLLLIGTSAGKWLPKTGVWMNAVKFFFGILLLGVAIFLLERILPKTLVMVLWSALLIFSGIYCGALTKSQTNHEKFLQGLGLMLLLYGLLILVGASMGNTNPLQPLAKSQLIEAATAERETVHTLNELEKAIAAAKGKPIMLDFYADWCNSCKVMESTLFPNSEVKAALQDFVVIRVDITSNSEDAKALMSRFNVVAPPTFVFLNKEGLEKRNMRLVGEISPKEFLSNLKQ